MSTRQRALLQAGLWSAYVLLSLLAVRAYRPLSASVVLIMLLVAFGLWAATEALRAAVLRRRWLELAPPRLLLRLALAPLLAALAIQGSVFVLTSAAVALGLVEPPPRGAQPSAGVWFGYVANTTIMLWLWIGSWAGWQYLRRWRAGEIERWRAEASKSALELQVLRAQVNPHFIFNALNNLRALINEDPARAREMVTRLSNTLRHTLQHSTRERVPLDEELALVRDYIALEQLHYEDRLQVRWQIAPSASHGASLPPMVLQLLVENAIKHGIARSASGGVVAIEIERAAEQLRLRVSNPGRWQPGPDAGIGLQHLRARLARAGGPGAQCQVDEAQGRVQVQLSFAAA